MSAGMYPERRPYATTTPHSGYLAKPFLPPVEALRILNSTVGIDLPRGLRRGRRASDASAPDIRAGTAPRPPKRPPSATGKSSDAWANIELATPFNFKEKDYHLSQQVMLNAQLNAAVEELLKLWNGKVRDLLNHLRTYPPQGATSYSLTNDAMESYFDGYRAADVQPLPAEELVQDFKLGSTPEMLDDIKKSPEIAMERVRRTLEALLNSNHFLAPLEHYMKELEALGVIALPDEPLERIKGPDGEEAVRGAVVLTKAAVALHEKFHFDPAEYALCELRKSDGPLGRLERRIFEEKEAKENAVDESMPGEAFEHLTMQVDLSNDLLLMNKARMEIVRLHSRDVHELRPLVDTVIADARRSSELLKGRTERDLPIVQKDIDRVRKDLENTEEHIKTLHAQNIEANTNARRMYKDIDGKERDLWEELLAVMQKLVGVADEKDAFLHREMKMREQRARDEALATELLNAQLEYFERLRASEELLWRWTTAARVYDAYVEAYAPKLLKKVQDAEDADEELQNHEAQEYVRRYNMFEFAVEEARATRQVYVDRIRRLQRSKALDVARALDTLDPNRTKYDRELSGAQSQLEEAEAYIGFVGDLERERREEVEPTLQRVILFNRTTQTQLADAAMATVPAEGRLARDAEEAAAEEVAAKVEAQKEPQEPEQQQQQQQQQPQRFSSMGAAGTDVSTKSEPLWLRSTDGRGSPMLATVAHPHLQARTIGIEHEDMFLTKIKKFTDDELVAVEDVVGKMGKTRETVDKFGIKYDNRDYVRMTMGGGTDRAF